jgi:hypothetical protein
MVLLQKMRLTELEGKARSVPLRFVHERELPASSARLQVRAQPTSVTLEDGAERTLLAIEGTDLAPQATDTPPPDVTARDAKKPRSHTNHLALTVALSGGGSREFVVKLPSPPLAGSDRAKLRALDFAASRAGTIAFWNGYLSQGANSSPGVP